jgi:hypothetical protein
MKNSLELLAVLQYSRKYNIWSNPKRPDDVQTDCCEYCGKKVGKNPLAVHVTYRGTCLPNDVTEEEIDTVEQSQGCFNIGANCAKTMFGSDIDRYTLKL